MRRVIPLLLVLLVVPGVLNLPDYPQLSHDPIKPIYPSSAQETPQGEIFTNIANITLEKSLAHGYYYFIFDNTGYMGEKQNDSTLVRFAAVIANNPVSDNLYTAFEIPGAGYYIYTYTLNQRVGNYKVTFIIKIDTSTTTLLITDKANRDLFVSGVENYWKDQNRHDFVANSSSFESFIQLVGNSIIVVLFIIAIVLWYRQH